MHKGWRPRYTEYFRGSNVLLYPTDMVRVARACVNFSATAAGPQWGFIWIFDPPFGSDLGKPLFRKLSTINIEGVYTCNGHVDRRYDCLQFDRKKNEIETAGEFCNSTFFFVKQGCTFHHNLQIARLMCDNILEPSNDFLRSEICSIFRSPQGSATCGSRCNWIYPLSVFNENLNLRVPDLFKEE